MRPLVQRFFARLAPGRWGSDALAPPRFLFMQINKRCNLKCGHCNFWTATDDDRPNYLDLEGRRRVMGEFQRLNPKGAVVICGGEAMLDLDDYFDMSRRCRSLGLTCLSVINGTRVRSPEMADRMIAEGPHEISVSLNSHVPELHDRTRGVPGSFDKACKAIRLLVDARNRASSPTRIYAMGLIFDENYRDIEAFYDFVLNDLKADKLKLNFLQPSFGEHEVDHFFASHHKVDADELVAVIRRSDERFRLNLNPVWLDNVGMYFRSLQQARDPGRGWASPTRTTEHICNTYERNIMVDHYGVARLCFSGEFRGQSLKKDGDLARFWFGASDIRCEMRSCNRLCGISHSVRRASSTLTPAAYSIAHASPPVATDGARAPQM